MIRHFYEVSNLGPQTIGGVELRVAWPTGDGASGRAVSALEGAPFVRYKGPTADYTDDCEIRVRNTTILRVAHLLADLLEDEFSSKFCR